MSFKRHKIINDPVYGFISIPSGIIFEILSHPDVQRLRRIKQLGLTDYVYPGASHSRYHHALGALHLTMMALDVLDSKNVAISEEEKTGACLAILLHDVGHGPFSHTLESTIVPFHHEEVSLAIMEKLNKEFGGALDLAISIFKNQYHRKFLNQLISGQLDMDRMDYLMRDSFFTGVAEGIVGYKRIIHMLHVENEQLVVEEKGIYSIERFLTARSIMYWQVYLHKTVLAVEQMLIKLLLRIKELVLAGNKLPISNRLNQVIKKSVKSDLVMEEILQDFMQLDDYDIVMAMKNLQFEQDVVLSKLSRMILDRKIFKLDLSEKEFKSDQIEKLRLTIGESLELDADYLSYFVFTGQESNTEYNLKGKEIEMLFKDGSVLPMSKVSGIHLGTRNIYKNFLCYPRI